MAFLPLTEKQRTQARESKGLVSSAVEATSDFFGAIPGGLKEDPFVALAIDNLSEIEGVDPDGLEELRNRTKGSTAAQAGHIFGEYGPSVLFGLASMGGGTVAARGLVKGVAKKLSEKAAVRTALEAATAGAVKTKAKKGLFKDQLDRIALHADDVAGTATRQIQGTPGLQRAAESVGANLGLGSQVATQEKARGKTNTEALKSAAIIMAIGGGVDLALVGGVRFLFPQARSVRLAEHRARLIESGAKAKGDKISSVRDTRREEMKDAVWDTLGVGKQQQELEFGIKASKSQKLRAGLEKRVENTWGVSDAKTLPVKDLLRQRRLDRTVAKTHRELTSVEGTVPYIGSGPSYFMPVRRVLDKLDPSGKIRASLFTAQESRMGTMGAYFNQIASGLKVATTQGERNGAIAVEQMSLWGETLRKAIGTTSRKWKNGVGDNLNMTHAWEGGGGGVGGPVQLAEFMKKAGRSNDDITSATAVFMEREAFDHALYQVKGRQIGAKDALDLDSVGVKRYLGHVSVNKSEVEMAQLMTASGKHTEAEAMAILKSRGTHFDPDPISYEGVGSGTMARSGPLDFDRVGKGTLRDKITDQGIPMNPNIWDSGASSAQAAHMRIALQPILGGAIASGKKRALKGGTVDEIVGAVEAEGYSGAQARTLLETLAGRQYYNEAMSKFATMTTSIQVVAKLPLAVLANASQFVLTTTWAGVKPSFKGLLAATNKVDRHKMAQALAFQQHMIRGIGRSVDDLGLALTSAEKAADWTLRFSLFSPVERFNRIHAAFTSQAVVRDRLVRGAAGRLRGTRSDSAKKMLGEIGMDLDVLVRDLRDMGPEAFFSSAKYLRQEETAVLLGAQKTQFFPGRLRTPTFWQHPLGRVLFQFKTFSVGQSRFLRDAVLHEYSNGNLAPMATLLSFSPIAGEAVGDLKALIKDKNRDESGLWRYIDNSLAIGGWGIFSDAIGQAKHGNLESIFLGPSVGDFSDFMELAVSADGEAIWNMLMRQPAAQGTNFLAGMGAMGVGEVAEYLDSDNSDDPSTTTIDIGQRLTERIQSKR